MSKAGGQSLGLFQRMQILRLMPFEPMVSTLSLTILWHAKFNEGMLDKKRMLFGRRWTHHKSQDREEWSWGWDTVKSPGACCSKCGPWISSIGISCKLVKDSKSQVSLETYWFRNKILNKIHGWFKWTLYSLRGIVLNLSMWGNQGNLVLLC